MDVLVTGAHGTVGSAIREHLGEAYDFTYLDVETHPDVETYRADVADYDAIRPAFDGVDAVIHLAVHPLSDDEWAKNLETNIVGTYNVLEAANDAGVERFVFTSSNHVLGMYELENAPEIYDPDHGRRLDRWAPHRPDSYYGTTKAFGEDLCRYYTEGFEYPNRCYVVRIYSVRSPRYDHPYGDAEKGVDRGEWTRDSPEYERQVARLKATWQSRRDLARQIDCCLRDETVTYDVFYGVSDNDGRWVDLEHARDVLGYEPQDNGAEWDEPPT